MTITKAPTRPTVQGLLLHRAFRNAIPFAAPAGEIPSLNAVRISATGGILTIDATDRYKLLRQTLPIPGAAFDPLVVSLADLQMLTKQIGSTLQQVPKRMRDQAVVTFTAGDNGIVVATGMSSMYAPPLDLNGTVYPELDRLLDPKAKRLPDVIGMRSEHLAAFAAVKLGADDRHGYVDWHFHACGMKPSRWTAVDETTGHTLEALLMPVRLAEDVA